MQITSTKGRQVSVFILLAISLGLLLSLHFFSPSKNGLWWITFYNSLHVVVFAVITVSLFVGTSVFSGWTRTRNAVVACTIAIALGVVSEVVQIPGPRDATITDLFSDAGGAIGALLLALAICSTNSMRNWKKAVLSIAGISILLTTLAPLISVSTAYIGRNYKEPLLFSFNAGFFRTFVRMQNSTLEIIDQPPTSRKVGQITLSDGAWPGIIFHDLWPDWRSYSMLIIDLVVTGEAPLDINIRVHDAAHKQGDQSYGDRFNMTNLLRPGRQTLKISIDEIRNAPTGRKMDLSQIDGIVIFCSAKDAGRQFQLLELRLE